MNGKEIFIKKIEELLNDCPDFFGSGKAADAALTYFYNFKNDKTDAGNSKLTENGLKVLEYLQLHHMKYNNVLKATDIAEGLGTTGKSVSGSMRKLVSDGYVEKIGEKPVTYAITEKGISYSLT